MRWLIDEMFPGEVAERLTELGHDARAVVIELRGLTDAQVFDVAVSEGRVVVTENVVDFAGILEDRIAAGDDVVSVLFALKAGLPRRAAGLSARLAQRLDTWARSHPDPAATAYWL